MSEIQIPAHDKGTFKAYVAMPEKAPSAVIIMIQEIFGINQEMRDKCDDMAKQGYIAICPDLFWRIEPNIELIDSKPDELERAFDLFGQFDVSLGLSDLKTTLGFARTFDGSNGKVGCIGYCLGGKLAYMLACDSDIDASVAYYGVGIEDMTAASKQLKNPLMLHIAEEDQFVSKEAQEQIKLALMPNRKIKIHCYPGVNHAFARGQGMHYNQAAAETANMRSAEFLQANLQRAQ